MQESIVFVLNALTLISILALVSLGLFVVFGLTNVVNLAHGEFVTIGAYVLVAVQLVGGSYWIALAVAPAVGAVVGYAIERFVIRGLHGNAGATILSTWGLSLILQQALQFSFGSSPQAASGPFVGIISLGEVSYPAYRFFLIIVASTIFAFVLFLVYYTDLGLNMRALIQNNELARTLGIDPKRVTAIAFSVGGAAAAVAGVLIAPLTVVIAQIGVNYLARSFLLVLVAGVRNPAGILTATIIFGGLETALHSFLPPTLAQAVVLLLCVLFMGRARYGTTG